MVWNTCDVIIHTDDMFEIKRWTWCINMRTTAKSRAPVLGSSESAFAWSRSSSPNAQYMVIADGNVNVKTYKVAVKYTVLNFLGFHIACIISLHTHAHFLDIYYDHPFPALPNLTFQPSGSMLNANLYHTLSQHAHQTCREYSSPRWSIKPTWRERNALHSKPVTMLTKVVSDWLVPTMHFPPYVVWWNFPSSCLH